VSLVVEGDAQRDAALDQLRVLRKALPESVLLFAGGRAAEPLSAQIEALGAKVPSDITAFRHELRRHDERVTRARPQPG